MHWSDEDFARIEASGLFDARWYLDEYADVAAAGLDPLHHYLQFGAAEGRLPGPDFDPTFYIGQLTCPLPSGMPALLHYLREGKADGLDPVPTPEWVPSWYQGEGHGPAEIDHSAALRVLYVLAIETGGTPQTNQDLMTALTRSGQAECLLLRCRGRLIRLLIYAGNTWLPLERHTLAEPLAPFPHHNKEYDRVLADWLQRYRVDCIHVRHLVWQSLGLVTMAQEAGARVVLSLHDYYALCPSVKLLDEQDCFCGGCCTASAGDCRVELWPPEQIPRLKHHAIHDWQRMFETTLARCDALITTSNKVRTLFRQVYPALQSRPFHVIEHGRDFAELEALAVEPTPDRPLRIVVPGYLTAAKGAHWLLELARQTVGEGVEWHVLGSLVVADAAMPANLMVHGSYSRAGIAERVRAIRPHLGAVLSIWAETWCHTLTELWACGLPVIGGDIGAVGERLRHNDGGWPVTIASVTEVHEALAQARQPEHWRRKQGKVIQWQTQQPETGSVEAMAEKYLACYQCRGMG